MDFALPYTEEQQQFRQEVRSWLQENIPDPMKEPIDRGDLTEEQYWFWRGKHRELAAKGWLYPTFPKEYGGGGLTGDHETVIQEEFLRARVANIGHSVADFILPTLLVWGTEEQKQKFLVPFLKAEQTAWQKFTEPQSGADLANLKSRAVRDGDDWILTGQNAFIGSYGKPDWLYGPMVTDPEAPRHRNLGYFLIPYPSPGLEIIEMNLLFPHKHMIYLNNVQVPGDHLIGGDHQGWQVAMTTLEQEHGGRGKAFPTDKMVDDLVSYVQETKHNGSSLGSDPLVQQTALDSYIEAQVDSLLAKRAYWMYQQRMEISHQGNEAAVHHREYTLRNAIRVRDVMGIFAMLGTKEPDAPHGGAQEVEQSHLAGQHHAGGSTNIAKVILARRIGISRTKERAAPTPSTATSYGS